MLYSDKGDRKQTIQVSSFAYVSIYIYIYIYINIIHIYHIYIYTHIYIIYIYMYIYIYIYIFQISHKSCFTPVRADLKQTIQVSSFAWVSIYICKVKAKATKIWKCVKTLFTVKT